MNMRLMTCGKYFLVALRRNFKLAFLEIVIILNPLVGIIFIKIANITSRVREGGAKWYRNLFISFFTTKLFGFLVLHAFLISLKRLEGHHMREKWFACAF